MSVAVLLSLALSVTVVPLLARWTIKNAKPETHGGRLERVYGSALDAMLRNRVVAVLIALVYLGQTIA